MSITRSDITRHFRARVALVNALYELPRVQAAVDDLGQRLEAVLREHRSVIEHPAQHESAAAQEMVCRYTVLPIEWAAALVDALEIPPPIRNVAGTDLALAGMAAASDAIGQPLGLTVEYNPRRPPVNLTYTARPDEPFSDAWQRLIKQVGQTLLELVATELPDGREPSDGGEAIERGARWWVAKHVEGKSISVLSDSYVRERTDLDPDQRKTVRYGIRAATQALSLELPLVVRWGGDQTISKEVGYLPWGLKTS